MSTASRGPQGNLFIFYGDEDFFLDRGLEVVRRWSDRTLIFLDADEGLTEAEIVRELETNGFEETPRTVIVENAQKVKESKGKLLRAYAENLKGTTSVLAAFVRSEKISEMWTSVGSKGKLTEHKKFKPWPDKSGKTEYEKWFESEAKRVGLALDKGVSEFIFQMCGDDLYRLRNELKKLYTLVGNGNKVLKSHVASVIAVTPRSEPKDVVEAALAKDPKAAMNALSQVYKTMGEEASIPIVYGLMREVQKALSARQLVDKKASDEDIAVALGMNPWRCKTFFLPMVKRHNQSALIGSMKKLRKLDEDVKGSSRSKRTLVELAILSIAG